MMLGLSLRIKMKNNPKAKNSGMIKKLAPSNP